MRFVANDAGTAAAGGRVLERFLNDMSIETPCLNILGKFGNVFKAKGVAVKISECRGWILEAGLTYVNETASLKRRVKLQPTVQVDVPMIKENAVDEVAVNGPFEQRTAKPIQIWCGEPYYSPWFQDPPALKQQPKSIRL